LKNITPNSIKFYELGVPAKGEYSIKQITKNLYLVKDSLGRGGVLLTRVDTMLKMPLLENLEFRILGNKRFYLKSGEEKILNDNLLLRADYEGQIEVLQQTIKVLLTKFGSDHDFTSQQLRDAVLFAIDIWKQQKSKRQEVVGVIGELYWLNQRIEESTDEGHALYLIDGWESSTRRTNIDFNYEYHSLFFEIKTSSNGMRLHHFKGKEQLELFASNDEGYVCSIMLSEDDNGFSAFHLVQSTSEILLKRGFVNALKSYGERCSIRGMETQDNEYRFNLCKNGVKYYRMSELDIPVIKDSIVDVSWTTDFEQIDPISFENEKSVLNQLKL
jgi:hypothetical protein